MVVFIAYIFGIAHTQTFAVNFNGLSVIWHVLLLFDEPGSVCFSVRISSK